VSVGFIKKKFVTMHGHINVKIIYIFLFIFIQINILSGFKRFNTYPCSVDRVLRNKGTKWNETRNVGIK
jgi:hypothetical protein